MSCTPEQLLKDIGKKISNNKLYTRIFKNRVSYLINRQCAFIKHIFKSDYVFAALLLTILADIGEIVCLDYTAIKFGNHNIT